MQVAEQNGGAYRLAVRCQRLLEELACFDRPGIVDLGGGQFAIEVGDFLLPQVAGVVGQLLRDIDGLAPFLFLLVDLEEKIQGRLVQTGAAQTEEDILGAVEQAGLEIIVPQFSQGLQARLIPQPLALDEVLMHADGPIGLAAAAKQVAQGEVQLDRLGVHLGGLQEGVDGLVWLLVEQEVESLEIGLGQGARLADDMPDVHPRRHPAEGEKQRNRQQPPQFEFHSRPCSFCPGGLFRPPPRLQFLPQANELPALSQERPQRGRQAGHRTDREE